MTYATAIRIARRRVFSDGVQFLIYRDGGDTPWAEPMSLDNQGSHAHQVRKAVAARRHRYAEFLMMGIPQDKT